MQASSDIFLGWLAVAESAFGAARDYYVRQLRDWKGSVVVEAMDERALSVYGQLCAATLAHAHARSGDRIAIASYLGSGDVFDRAILAFSEAYAEQNDRDYASLLAAVETGRVQRRPQPLMAAPRAGSSTEATTSRVVSTGRFSSRRSSPLRMRSDTIWRSLGIVEVTMIVFWLAHVYAGALAWSIDGDETFSRREVRRVAGREWPLLQAAIVPSIALLAGCIGLIGSRMAYRIAVGYGVAALIWWGLLFARKEGLGRGATIAVVLVNASFGLVIVVLKEFVSH